VKQARERIRSLVGLRPGRSPAQELHQANAAAASTGPDPGDGARSCRLGSVATLLLASPQRTTRTGWHGSRVSLRCSHRDEPSRSSAVRPRSPCPSRTPVPRDRRERRIHRARLPGLDARYVAVSVATRTPHRAHLEVRGQTGSTFDDVKKSAATKPSFPPGSLSSERVHEPLRADLPLRRVLHRKVSQRGSRRIPSGPRQSRLGVILFGAATGALSEPELSFGSPPSQARCATSSFGSPSCRCPTGSLDTVTLEAAFAAPSEASMLRHRDGRWQRRATGVRRRKPTAPQTSDPIRRPLCGFGHRERADGPSASGPVACGNER
jgi:hypothetical protein